MKIIVSNKLNFLHPFFMYNRRLEGFLKNMFVKIMPKLYNSHIEVLAKNIKILINISVVSKNHRGMGMFTKEILLKLLEDKSFEFILVSCTDIDKSTITTNAINHLKRKKKNVEN